jgi:hypothetical protein
MLFFSIPAVPASIRTSAQIELKNSLNLSEEEKINFGVVEIPSGEFSIVHLTPSGTIGENNTANIIESSGISSGKVNIFGSNSSSINIQATPSSPGERISITKITGNYSSSSDFDLISGISDLAPPGDQGKSLMIGAEIRISNNVVEGNYILPFDLEVNYQ